MPRWGWWGLVVAVVLAGVALAFLPWLAPSRGVAKPLSVEGSDQEIAWLHNPTSFETWENFVWGVKRAEMAGDGGPEGLEVDESGAYPDKTTDVPEVVIRRRGFGGTLRIRWYKVTDEAPQEAWVAALARRDPPPLAVLSGWSSDRAKTLADAMREAKWRGPRPLYFLAQATADTVDPETDAARGGQGPSLISLYDRSFRFCFTNQQMAEAVTDFVLSDPTLRPGPVLWPGLRAVAASAGGLWPGLSALATDTYRDPAPIPGFAVEWADDPYSTDLCYRFREALRAQAAEAGLPRLNVEINSVPFSVGRLNRPNAAEAQVAEHILANLPPPGTRTVLVLPTVSAPARRTMRSLVQGNPAVGRQLVAVTGDGLGMNTFFRDREFAWPVRSIPVPFVLFLHADPFGWDTPSAGPAAPPGYELTAPRPGTVRSSTEDVRHFTKLARIVATAAFPDGAGRLADGPDAVAERLRSLSPAFFDRAGNRRSGTGEHVVVLRPVLPGESRNGKRAEATLEVYTRPPASPIWTRIHSTPLHRATGGPAE